MAKIKWLGKDSIVRKETPYLIGSDKFAGVVKVIEEMTELGTELAKLMSQGRWKYLRDSRKTVKLTIEEEIADVEATLEFLKAKNRLDRKFIEKRKKEKIKKFNRWHKNIQEGRDPNDNGEDDTGQHKPSGDKGVLDPRTLLARNPRRADDAPPPKPKRKKQSSSSKSDATL